METNNAALTINISPNIGSIDSYISQIQQFPVLSAEEEMQLAEKLHENQDLSAAKALIMSHLRLVVKIARKYSGYGLPIADLIQEGNIGLMKAVKKFDPKVGVRLVSFAVHWIKAEINEFVIRNWRIVKIATTKAQRKLFFNLRSTKSSLEWVTSKECEEIARALNVDKSDVTEMDLRLHSYDAAFDSPSKADENAGNDFAAPVNYIADRSFDPSIFAEKHQWNKKIASSLSEAIASLDTRSKAIIVTRWLDENKKSLQELATEFDVSVERVRQIEASAIKKIRDIFEQKNLLVQ